MLLKAHDIYKSYYSPSKVEVLRGLSLEVDRGEAVAIMGSSGEGKSTLLQILGTLERPCEGSIEFLDLLLESYALPTLRNQQIGFVFQTYNLLEDYTLLENLTMPARIARKKIDLKRAYALLAEVGLEGRADFLARQLSGGEKQRGSIARALFNDPALILADEPSGNLDRSHSQQIHQLLIETVKERGKTAIVVTHDPELAAMCDRTLLLKEGRLICIS